MIVVGLDWHYFGCAIPHVGTQSPARSGKVPVPNTMPKLLSVLVLAARLQIPAEVPVFEYTVLLLEVRLRWQQRRIQEIQLAVELLQRRVELGSIEAYLVPCVTEHFNHLIVKLCFRVRQARALVHYYNVIRPLPRCAGVIRHQLQKNSLLRQ